MEEHLGEHPQPHQQVHLELLKQVASQYPVPKTHEANQSPVYYFH